MEYLLRMVTEQAVQIQQKKVFSLSLLVSYRSQTSKLRVLDTECT